MKPFRGSVGTDSVREATELGDKVNAYLVDGDGGKASTNPPLHFPDIREIPTSSMP